MSQGKPNWVSDALSQTHKKVTLVTPLSQLKSIVRNNIGAILMTTGIWLSGSAIGYSTWNNITNSDGDGMMPAKTLLTHTRWLDKIDIYDNPIPWSDWEYRGSELTKNGQNVSALDALLWYPGNGMIFIWWVLLAWFGISLSSEKKKAFLQQIKKSLLSWEKVMFTYWKGDLSKNATLSFKAINKNQTEVTIVKNANGEITNEVSVEGKSIESIVDILIWDIASKMITE